uniref:Phospholipid transport system substrate-binding protein n=1 Tax=Candidatus Kentrum sp. DK TaxID=2126562 RepID=A0A450TI47_9GAMM|nr:MAG: phospholipid transport system substrate-binding protein [Candidatus Kentron sp. DK]
MKEITRVTVGTRNETVPEFPGSMSAPTGPVRGVGIARILIGGLLFLGLYGLSPFFEGAEPRAEPVAAAPEQGLEMVRETSQRLLETIGKEGLDVDTDLDRLYELIDEIIFKEIDFHRMSARILGRSWRAATSAQKEQFIAQFKIYLLRTYATALSAYKGQKIEYLPIRTKTARAVKIQTRIQLTQAAPVEVDYVLLLSEKGSWKIIDMMVEGISLVVTHRSSFQSTVKKEGLSGLIAELEARNREKPKPSSNQP